MRVLGLRALQPDIGGLRAGGLELRLRLRHVRDRGAAAVVEILRQIGATVA